MIDAAIPVPLIKGEDAVKFLTHDLTRAALIKNVVKTWAGGIQAGDANNAFLYTLDKGWIDLGHFWLSALAGYTYGSVNAYLLGVVVEFLQVLTPPPLQKASKGFEEWFKSAFTVEDLSSDWLGAKFGQSLRGKKYTAIGPEFEKLLKSWKPVQSNDKVFGILLRKEADMLRRTNKKTDTILPTPYLGPFNEQMKKSVGELYWK
jgi:hypothetical protein